MTQRRQYSQGSPLNLKGDIVVWLIFLLLIMISIVCGFSSTSRLLKGEQTRIDLLVRQLEFTGVGLVLVLVCYNIRNVNFFRRLSKCGFILSAALLTLLASHKALGPIKPIYLNGAWRILSLGGLQIHVFEVVKIAMVLYFAWAMDAYKRKELKFGSNEFRKRIIYIYFPFVYTFVLVLLGSNSSGLFIGGIMLVTIMLGGGNIKELAAIGLAGVAVILILYACNLGRIRTGINRFAQKENWQDSLKAHPYGSIGYYEAVDKLRQEEGAKIAIKEGGFLGKGPGQSTQRYSVPAMAEDYMFSFIIEEYGYWGALMIVFLYVSLLARGAVIVRNCKENLYAKLAVAGLTLTISGQAFLHMFVNADIGPMTGQTLPIISHGNSALLCFCVAFGVLLSISRQATDNINREIANSDPIVEPEYQEEEEQ